MINSGDTAWVLISTALVILMTPALGFFYAGMVRKKNVLSTLMLSVVMLALITVQWILYGYSISFGTDHAGIIGGLNWIGLNGVGGAPHLGYAPTIPHLLFMFFQLAFAVITPALITGAFVERIKFPSFLLFSLLWVTFIYAPVAHWVWGIGGWLRAMGAFLLWFGWFGFNGGSALSASSIAVSAVVATNAAGASAALTWMLLNWMHKRPSLLGFSTGAIVGLAAVTPASGFISPLSALIIGVVAATLSYYMIIFRLKVGLDESLDVFACHGIGGIWGTLALGLFAQKAINVAGNDGLFFGNPGFFGIQIFAVLIVVIFSFVGTYFLAKVVDTLFSLRAKESEEDVGMDLAYHGETTY